jgi:signal transduction histidine kinase
VERKPSGVIRTFFIRAMLLVLGIVGVLLASLVVAVHETTRPVAQLASAVRHFAREMDAPDLPPSGPKELRQLSADFNEMKHRIRDLVAQRTQMLAAVAHDIRTYMTRLRLRSEFIADPVQRMKAHNDIEEMARLIDDTMLFARVSSGPARLERMDIGVALDALIAEQQWPSEKVSLSALVTAPFFGSRQAIERIVVNLVDNALRYGAPPVEIVVDRGSNHITITVTDHGPGIPNDKLEKVIDPFERLEPSRGRESGGAGLGLAIVHALAGAQGGSFQLDNAQHGGVQATITLPTHPT